MQLNVLNDLAEAMKALDGKKCKTSAGSSKIFRWLAPLLGPNLDPKTGPKQRPKRRNENVIQFWTHLRSIFGPKNGVSHRRISLLPANVLQADLRPSSFSLCASQGRLLLSRSLYRSHVLSTFFGPVLGAMMKQVCGIRAKRSGTRTKRGSRTRIYIIHVKTDLKPKNAGDDHQPRYPLLPESLQSKMRTYAHVGP